MKLEINKQDVDLQVDCGFMGNLIDYLGESFEDVIAMSGKNPYKFYPKALYVSAKWSAEYNGKEFKYTELDFVKWVSENGNLSDDNVILQKWANEFNKFLGISDNNVPKGKEDNKGSKKK